MLIKATRFHPGVPLQVYMVGMVVAEDVDIAESDLAVSVGMLVKATAAAITELAI
jgi:hypothetical protein